MKYVRKMWENSKRYGENTKKWGKLVIDEGEQ